MRALTVCSATDGSRFLKYRGDYPKPNPGRGEVLIKVWLAGICGTDLHILQGYKSMGDSFVLGHEFIGTIESFGPDTPYEKCFQINDRVVAEINCVQFECTTSRTAYERAQDPRRTAFGIFGRDGAFADFVAVPFENVHRVPDNVSNRRAVFTEPIAAACQILEEIHIPPTKSVAVLGAGKLGWIVAKVLAASGKGVDMISRRKVSSIPQHVRRWGPSNGQTIPVFSLEDPHFLDSMSNSYSVVVDCTGSSKGMEVAIQLVEPRGTIALKSTGAPNSSQPIDLTPIVIKEVRIVGSRCGPFVVALKLLQTGMLDIDSLITEVRNIEESESAFEKATEPETLKILLEF